MIPRRSYSLFSLVGFLTLAVSYAATACTATLDFGRRLWDDAFVRPWAERQTAEVIPLIAVAHETGALARVSAFIDRQLQRSSERRNYRALGICPA